MTIIIFLLIDTSKLRGKCNLLCGAEVKWTVASCSVGLSMLLDLTTIIELGPKLGTEVTISNKTAQLKSQLKSGGFYFCLSIPTYYACIYVYSPTSYIIPK